NTRGQTSGGARRARPARSREHVAPVPAPRWTTDAGLLSLAPPVPPCASRFPFPRLPAVVDGTTAIGGTLRGHVVHAGGFRNRGPVPAVSDMGRDRHQCRSTRGCCAGFQLGVSPTRSQGRDGAVRLHAGSVPPANVLVSGQDAAGGVGSRREGMGIRIAEADVLV